MELAQGLIPRKHWGWGGALARCISQLRLSDVQ